MKILGSKNRKQSRVVNRLKNNLNFNAGYKKVVADPALARTKKLARRQNTIRIEASIFLLLLLVVAFQGLKLSSDPVINITGRGFTSELVAKIEDQVRISTKDTISNSLFSRFKPLVPREDILASINTIPVVKNAGLNVSRSGSRPIINVELEEAVAIYRRGSSSYLLSSTGKLISPEDSLLDKSGLPIIDDTLFNIDDLELNESVVSAVYLDSVIGINNLLNEQGSVAGDFLNINIYQINENPSEILALTTKGNKIIFFASDNSLGQGASLVKFVSSLTSAEQQAISIIDARIPGRIVYK